MTTEVLAALLYGPKPPACLYSKDGHCESMSIAACMCPAEPPDPYFEGEDAREANYALLSNPYAPGSTSWHNWRSGWNVQDAMMKPEEFHRVSSRLSGGVTS